MESRNTRRRLDVPGADFVARRRVPDLHPLLLLVAGGQQLAVAAECRAYPPPAPGGKAVDGPSQGKVPEVNAAVAPAARNGLAVRADDRVVEEQGGGRDQGFLFGGQVPNRNHLAARDDTGLAVLTVGSEREIPL